MVTDHRFHTAIQLNRVAETAYLSDLIDRRIRNAKTGRRTFIGFKEICSVRIHRFLKRWSMVSILWRCSLPAQIHELIPAG